MGKKQPVIEEVSDEEFEDIQFSDSDEAPVTLKKSEAKQKYEKSDKKSSSKKIRKEKKVQIRGADIFDQELPEETVKDLKTKHQLIEKQQQEQEILDSKRKQLEKRNAKVEKKERKNSKHIIFLNKRTGKQFMVSNKTTMEKLDPISEETESFLSKHMSRLHRVPLNSII